MLLSPNFSFSLATLKNLWITHRSVDLPKPELALGPWSFALSSGPRVSLTTDASLCIWEKLNWFPLNPDLDSNSKIWGSCLEFRAQNLVHKDSVYTQLSTVALGQPELCEAY